jgi:hypothetical protein
MERIMVKNQSVVCNEVIRTAVHDLLDQGIDPDVIIDRLLTFGAGYAVQLDGAGKVAEDFRKYADQSEGGLFDPVLKASH